MANKIIIKNGSGAPANGKLDTAELGFDKTNKALYVGNNGTSVLLVKAGQVILTNGNYGTVDPNTAGIAGVEGQLYFVML